MFLSRRLLNARCFSFCLLLCVVAVAFADRAIAQNSNTTAAPRAEELTSDVPMFRLAPTRTTTVTAPASGTVGQFNLRLGDQVQVGDIVLELQSERLRLELERALGNFHRAYLSQQFSGDRSETEEEIDSLAVRAAVSELREVFHKLRRLIVTAPFSGRIEHVHATEGELVRAGQPLLRMVETDYAQLRLPIDTRQVINGQELCVLFSNGRISGTVLEVLPASAETAAYSQVLQRPGIAVLLVPNPTAALDIGMLGYVPAHPYALLPAKYVTTLAKNSPVVTVQQDGGPVSELPIELIGSIGPEYALAIGPFQEGETLVEVTTPATGDTAAVTRPIENAVLFPQADPLPTNDQFESGFPALADRVPLLSGEGESLRNDMQLTAPADLPQSLEGVLFPLEYPLAATDAETLLNRWGMERRNLPIVEVVRSYFQQEINRKRLAIRTIDEVEYATEAGGLKDYVEAVGRLNDEFLAVLLAVTEMDNETLFGRMLTAYGAEAILEQPGPELLKLTPEQFEQIDRMQESFELQRQTLFEQYLAGNLPADQYRMTSRQALDAWRQDLALVLTSEQRERLAELTPTAAIPETNRDSANTTATSPANTSGEQTASAEDEDETPSRRIKIPELKQESALLPFLLLGGGVVLVLVLLVVGYIIYRKRSS